MRVTFSESILQFLREPTGSELEELMEGAEAFIAEIENEAQHRKEPHPTFEAATGDLQKFKEKNLNKNTTKSTNTWVNRFETWRRWRELPHKLEEIPKQNLNDTLERFFAEVQKFKGSEYEPDSLRTMLAALDRHLRQAGAKFSIIKDREFDGSRKTLKGRAIVLREGGLGKKNMKADALSMEKEEQLWKTEVLGGNNATYIVNISNIITNKSINTFIMIKRYCRFSFNRSYCSSFLILCLMKTDLYYGKN